jgi:hypothetical protein
LEAALVKYRHCQFGKTLFIALAIGAVLCLIMAGVLSKGAPISLVLAAMLAVCALFFSSFTIEVTNQHLRWKFGSGLIRKQVLLADIAHAEVTQTKVKEGWGIHLTLRGWLYNVPGFQAVAIRLKTGKQFLLGSDEPEKLVMALGEEINRF